MTLRRYLAELLTYEPRSVSSLARELGLRRGDLEDDLRHMLRSAAALGDDLGRPQLGDAVAEPDLPEDLVGVLPECG